MIAALAAIASRATRSALYDVAWLALVVAAPLARFALDQGRYTVAAGATGLIRACRDASVTYAKARKTFGVEIGQLAVLLVLIPALGLLFRYVVPERIGIIVLSALVAHTGWHWMIERGEQLAKFPFPKIDAAFLASAMRGLIAVLILALAVLLANSWLRRWIGVPKMAPTEDVAASPPGKSG